VKKRAELSQRKPIKIINKEKTKSMKTVKELKNSFTEKKSKKESK
jgi:hypothetical protein